MTEDAEVQNGNFSIAVVGTTSTGKSSFVNALCGRCILPVGVRKTTQYITEMFHMPDAADISIEHPSRGSRKYFSSDSQARDHLKSFQGVARTPSSKGCRANKNHVQANFVSDFMNRIQFDMKRKNPSQNISLILIDLPGYRYNGDDKQKKIILDGVENASIVFLFSAEETDSIKEKALVRIILNHMKRKEKQWQNVFFILNRCDAFSRDDNSSKCLNQKIQKLQTQIRNIKNEIFGASVDYPSADPVVHPLSALPVMYSQALFWNYGKLSVQGKKNLLSKSCHLKNRFLSDEKSSAFPRSPQQWTFEHIREYRNEIMRASYFDEFLTSFGQHIKNLQT